eukprot:CAMPEP_0174243018 /NCGR_PEP_ID=MMETSP0417-20130205/30019_1 /TAXON_ID=242541 /ORGANISM="Mayorella sp, Strain BSH-02190019" /LENGTH=391 /DNA_ID=CAMNT_0015322469 /DNA_START=42 /DNA_END=1214 /DNA_ORIENTATION=-
MKKKVSAEQRQRPRKVPLRTAPTAVLPASSSPNLNTAGTLLCPNPLGTNLFAPSTTDQNPFASGRIPPCPDGALCPRQHDRAHLQHFSHPVSTSGASSKPTVPSPSAAKSLAPCPMGVNCSRLEDAVHLRHFVHQRVVPPRSAQAKRKVATRTPTKAVLSTKTAVSTTSSGGSTNSNSSNSSSATNSSSSSSSSSSNHSATIANKNQNKKKGKTKAGTRHVAFQLPASHQCAVGGRAPLHSSRAPSFFFQHGFTSSLAGPSATAADGTAADGGSASLNTGCRVRPSVSSSESITVYLVRGVRYACGADPEQALFGLFSNQESAFATRKQVLDQFQNWTVEVVELGVNETTTAFERVMNRQQSTASDFRPTSSISTGTESRRRPLAASKPSM